MVLSQTVVPASLIHMPKLVLVEGLEPPRLATEDFESSASAIPPYQQSWSEHWDLNPDHNAPNVVRYQVTPCPEKSTFLILLTLFVDVFQYLRTIDFHTYTEP